ncbi:MAG: cell envelope integrity protein CreD [Gammaproteobacteria bacterium]|nr:cell envelope integrity protein CreD [Gammaproteobacteria bacterium]MDH5800132.1 cell envelope integrity protein CreD [Gammaproteobacteria bacterium]
MGNSIFSWLNENPAGKAFLVVFLIILLQIPINTIRSLVYERQSTERGAIEEVQSKWGGEQFVSGPMLVIPYKVKRLWHNAETGKKELKTYIEKAVFFPQEYRVTGNLHSETRYRGIFEVPLYKSKIRFEGYFNEPDFSDWEIQQKDVLWKKARLIMPVSDARSIQKQASLDWNGGKLQFLPGTDQVVGNKEGYHVPLNQFEGSQDHYTFEFELLLNGSKSLYFAPLGNNSLIEIIAPWKDPSFQGKWLPTTREVTDAGFRSQWQIPYLGRNYPQKTRDFSSIKEHLSDSMVGVELIRPVDNYRMTQRSLKYQLVFFALTFAVIWIMELMVGLRLHLMQYLFIGAGLCMFYLLELSLSEHLGFYWAYAIAAAAVVTMVSSYSYVVVRTPKRVAIIGVGLTVLYLYLLSLLQEQNYSLLIGSLGLFLVLGFAMYATRRIDWHQMMSKPILEPPLKEGV